MISVLDSAALHCVGIWSGTWTACMRSAPECWKAGSADGSTPVPSAA